MAALVSRPVTVTVPASSANLGPGFDTLGIALGLHDVVTAQATDLLGEVTIITAGEGCDDVPRDASHLVHRAMVAGFDAMGVSVPGVRLQCRNAIPHGRGLGSSSAAIVAGLCAARGLVVDGEVRLDDDQLFALAAELEGHPDNVAPTVFGGFTIAYRDDLGFHAVRLDVTASLAFVVFVPGTAVATKVARGLLPDRVSHADAARTAGRAALLVAALTGRPDHLMAATEDWLHQQHRAPAMPTSVELVDRLRRDGMPAVISGAGPSVLAMVPHDRVVDALELSPAGWRALELEVDTGGARTTR